MGFLLFYGAMLRGVTPQPGGSPQGRGAVRFAVFPFRPDRRAGRPDRRDPVSVSWQAAHRPVK